MARKRACEIYGIYDPRTEKLCYIGKCTIGVAARFRIHLKRLRDRKHHNPRLQNLFDKLARENLGSLYCEPLETCEPEQLASREVWWIADARAKGIGIFNVTDGGGTLGHTFSEERRRRMSEARRGVKPQWTEEGRRSFIEKQKLRTLTDAQKAALSMSMKGGRAAEMGRQTYLRHGPLIPKGSTLAASHKEALRSAKKRPGAKAVGDRIGVSKLNEEQVRDLWADYKSGMGCRRLGKKYGIAISSAQSIVSRKTWKHLCID